MNSSHSIAVIYTLREFLCIVQYNGVFRRDLVTNEAMVL